MRRLQIMSHDVTKACGDVSSAQFICPRSAHRRRGCKRGFPLQGFDILIDASW